MKELIDVMQEILADQQLIVPIWKPEITSRADLDAQGSLLPLVVLWGVKDAGKNLDMKVSVNAVRLEAELRVRLDATFPDSEWDSIFDLAQQAVARHARYFLGSLVDMKLPVPLCLEQEARRALLKSPP